MKRYIYLAVTVGALAMAALSFTGLVLADQPEMRVIWGIVWLLVGLGAVARGYSARAQAGEREAATLRDDLRAQVDLTAAQQERNRLARDLHDSIKQQLFSIQMSAAAAQARWESDPPGAQQAIADARRDAHEALVEMTALLQQLSPAPLEKVGLVQALRDQCEALGYRAEAEVTVDIGALPDDDAFPPGAQEALFRVAQEALSNVARHARAEHVTLSLTQADEDGPVVLEIRDDGQGYDLAAAPSGMGLANIRQRVTTLGGTLDVQSAPGAGTTLRVTAPLRPAPVVDRATPLLNRVILTGLLGGLALIAALFYPLYVLAPSGVIPGWMTGNPALGVLCGALAAGLAVGTGYAAAAWSGLRRPAFGALAGATAGLLAYMALGATAAAIPGLIWLRDPVPQWLAAAMAASVYPEDTRWFYSFGTIILLTLGAFWVSLLVGGGLGTLGSWLAARRKPAIPAISLTRPLTSWLTLGAVFSGLTTLILLLSVGGMFQGMTSNDIVFQQEAGGLWFVGHGMFAFPVITTLLIYLATAGGLYVIQRQTLPSNTHSALGRAQVTGVLLGSYSLGLAFLGLTRLWILLIPPTFWRVALGAALLVCAGLGVLHWLSLREVGRRWRALGLGRMHVPQILATLYLPVSLLILLISASDNFNVIPPVALFLILVGDVIALLALWRKPPTSLMGTPAPREGATGPLEFGALLAVIAPPSIYIALAFNLFSLWAGGNTDVAHVQQTFLAQAIATGMSLIVGMALVGLSILMLDGIMALGRLGNGRR